MQLLFSPRRAQTNFCTQAPSNRWTDII